MIPLPQPNVPNRPQTALRIVTNDELLEAEAKAEQEAKKQRDVVNSSLANHVRKCWDNAKDHKRDVEQQMLRNLRQRNGEYESSKLSEIRKFGGSEIFMRLTDTKCRTAAAWIRDVLSLDRPWDIEPTPSPSLPDSITQLIQQNALSQTLAFAQQAVMLGVQVDDTQFQSVLMEQEQTARREAQEAIVEQARDAAADMADQIDDQLVEGDFYRHLDDAISHDLTTFGTAILKAVVVRSEREREWTPGPDGKYQATVVEKMKPVVERVSPLDLYPSEDAEDIDHAAYLIEKYRLTRRQLRAFKAVEGYSAEEIDAVLDEFGRGGLREWTDIDSDRDDLEIKDDDHAETLDVLIYHGDAQGKLLLEWGMDEAQIADPLEEIAVECWLVGQRVIRAVLNDDPLGKRPYHKAVFYPRPGSFWGVGLPEVLRDTQAMCNAVARALANNVAIASGPQVAVTLEALPPGEDGSRMWPWKVWGFDQGYSTTNQPPISFFQPQSNAQELLYVYTEFSKMADEVSGIPAYVAGDTGVRGAGKTASGLSMLMGAATKNIKGIIANLDSGFIGPILQAFFDYNLQWRSGLPEYLGDCRIVTRGINSLEVRDQNIVRLQEFLAATNNPVDFQIMGPARRSELLRSVAKALSLRPDDIAPDAQEAEQQALLQQQMMMAQQPQDPGQQAGAQDLGPDGQPSQGTDYRLMNEG